MADKTYRITVEIVGEEDDCKISEALLDGEECEGFVILAMKEGGAECAMHHVSLNDIAGAICEDEHLMAASILAKGMRDARDYMKAAKMKNLMDIFRSNEE